MKSFIHKSDSLYEAFKDPEYRFLIIEPILSYGIALGLILFAVAFFIKQTKLQLTGLILAGVSALTFVPYLKARRAALPRIEQIFSMDDSIWGKAFMENTMQWHSATWMYTAVVILAIATIMVGSRRNQLGYGLSFATILIGVMAIQNALWLHYQDASAFHPNLRNHRAPLNEAISRRANKAITRETQLTAPISHDTRKLRQVRPIR